MQQLRASVAETSHELEEMARMSVGTLDASRTELESALGKAAGATGCVVKPFQS